MGLRDGFVRLLSRGPAAERDPDGLRELTTVPVFESMTLVADLEDHGIAATSLDTFNLVTSTVSDVKIMVRHADFEAAQALVIERASGGE